MDISKNQWRSTGGQISIGSPPIYESFISEQFSTLPAVFHIISEKSHSASPSLFFVNIDAVLFFMPIYIFEI
jgi:hypothetical protein